MDTPSNAARSALLRDIWTRVDPETVRRIVPLVAREAPRATGFFYSVLLGDDHARSYLSHQVVQDRLRGSLTAWLGSVFSEPVGDGVGTWIERQGQIGKVHSRIDVPPMLVSQGMRLVKRELCSVLMEEPGLRERRTEAVLFVNEVLDYALDCMNDAYFTGKKQSVRQSQSLRLFMAGPRLALECERQKAQLFNWHRGVVAQVVLRCDDKEIPELSHSDLALWIRHKAEFTFGNSAESEALLRGLDALESAFQSLTEGDLSQSETVLRLEALDEAVTALGFKLESVADRVVGTEAGFDALTQVMNRRYLPAILQQEVALSREHGNSFGLLLIDIDHFKRINDNHGHDSGDRVLSQVAQVLATSVRGGDFVFRYGGEEFLVLLAEVDATMALRKAEQIREAVKALRFDTESLRDYRLTVSVGVAVHDGHPDYKRALVAADRALYQAKNEGRDRVCSATSSAPPEGDLDGRLVSGDLPAPDRVLL